MDGWSKHNETTTVVVVLHPDSLKTFQGYQKCYRGDNGEVNMFGGDLNLRKQNKLPSLMGKKNCV
jgi:hypothetical protein